MTTDPEALLQKYLQLPDRLEAAIEGLNDTQLDWKAKEGWSIREYVHHTVEGEMIWQVNLRAAAGREGIAFPLDWLFCQEQTTWVQHWGYDRRPVLPALALFRASTRNLVEFLRCVPETWDHTGRITWPGAEKETILSVRDIVLMHISHTDQHAADIRAIREYHPHKLYADPD